MDDVRSQLELDVLAQMKRSEELTLGPESVLALLRKCGSPEEVARAVHMTQSVTPQDFQKNVIRIRDLLQEELTQWVICVEIEARERQTFKPSTHRA